ncbi:HpcH/HpaI aldolase/citrate lyase family protein [Nocardia callitridis]|uniref:CoA ester lyase n=1 Tax=Nocardia callitridis TaxID=648753 RepID=A0ABP9KKQ0_9NOCA
MTPRSWLYVPGHRVDRIGRALESSADAVVIDLEDAVPVGAKELALTNALAALDLASEDRAIWLRLNAIGSPWLDEELGELASAVRKPSGVRLPKAESPRSVSASVDRIDCPVHVMVESATALLDAREIVRCHPRVTGIALGEADLAADLRTESDGLEWARGWIVAVARAEGLASPVQSVWTDVEDIAGLAHSSRAARARGFFGRSVIHPKQIEIVNEAYTPSPSELRTAQRVVERAAAAAAAGESAVLDEDGRFIDPAVVANARIVLERSSVTAEPGVQA